MGRDFFLSFTLSPPQPPHPSLHASLLLRREREREKAEEPNEVQATSEHMDPAPLSLFKDLALFFLCSPSTLIGASAGGRVGVWGEAEEGEVY